MATLQWRPRRTKDNPYPQAQQPLARWVRGDLHHVLRANGSVVRGRSGHYVAVTLRGLSHDGNTVEAVAGVLEPFGYVRE